MHVIFKWVLFSLMGLKRVVDTPQHVVERKDGTSDSRPALRAGAGSRRDRRGLPVPQEPVLGAADSERRNCPSVLGVLSDLPEGISLQLPHNLCGEPPRKHSLTNQHSGALRTARLATSLFMLATQAQV